jgi:hypothetical protein
MIRNQIKSTITIDQKFWSENLKERGNLGDMGVGGRMMLKWNASCGLDSTGSG